MATRNYCSTIPSPCPMVMVPAIFPDLRFQTPQCLRAKQVCRLVSAVCMGFETTNDDKICTGTLPLRVAN